MSYHLVVPFTDKKRAPDVDEAIDRVVLISQQKKQRLAELDGELSATLAVAVDEALTKGASLRELATRLGVSAETVRTMKRRP